jgi:hypothetical protein
MQPTPIASTVRTLIGYAFFAALGFGSSVLLLVML